MICLVRGDTVLAIIMSTIFYLIFFGCFYYLLKDIIIKVKLRIGIVAILSLISLNVRSILFVFTIYFIVIALLLRFFIVKIIKKKNCQKLTLIILSLSLFISFVEVSYGVLNMNNIVKTEYTVTTKKNILQDYTVVMLADLHYPTTMNAKKLQTTVNQIKNEKADFVLLCGDIVDEYTTVSQRKEVFSILGQLSDSSKVYYVFGNHDSGSYSLDNSILPKDLTNLIEANGITVLQDQVVEYNNEITICGRQDITFKNRKNLNTLLKNVDQNDLLIVMDHQPRELEKNSNEGVDLHVSGHSHAGQIFPLYFIYELTGVNELNYGKKKIKQMIAINTSGIGGWAFPMRSEKHSEYTVINIKSS